MSWEEYKGQVSKMNAEKQEQMLRIPAEKSQDNPRT